MIAKMRSPEAWRPCLGLRPPSSHNQDPQHIRPGFNCPWSMTKACLPPFLTASRPAQLTAASLEVQTTGFPSPVPPTLSVKERDAHSVGPPRAVSAMLVRAPSPLPTFLV